MLTSISSTEKLSSMMSSKFIVDRNSRWGKAFWVSTKLEQDPIWVWKSVLKWFDQQDCIVAGSDVTSNDICACARHVVREIGAIYGNSVP